MEVKNPQAALLSDCEVLRFVNEMKSKNVTGNQEATQLATILYETSHYLQELSCNDQNETKIRALMNFLKTSPIPLTKQEKLMICNNPPESILQLSLIVKDCEEKMTKKNLSETEIEEWLQEINAIMT